MSYLFWLLPVLLIGFVVLRFLPKERKKTEVALKIPHLYKRFGITLSIIVLIAISGYYFLRSSKQSHAEPVPTTIECPVTMTPEIFNQMDLFDESSIAGYFYDKKFKRVTEVLDANDPLKKRRVYRYKLHSGKWNEEIFEEDNFVKEYAYTFSTTRGSLFYVFFDHKVYDAYTDYLKSLNADSLISSDYTNFDELLYSDKPVYRYQKRVFNKCGFWPNVNGYVYKISEFDKLKLANNLLDSTGRKS